MFLVKDSGFHACHQDPWPAWYDHRQMFFSPCQNHVQGVKQTNLGCSAWVNITFYFETPSLCGLSVSPPSALLIPLLSRAPAEAASLTPSPRALPNTGEQQGVNMHSTCEGTWVLSPWLAGALWGQVEQLVLSTLLWAGSEHAEPPEHVFTFPGGEGIHRMFSSTLQPSGSARKGSFQLV